MFNTNNTTSYISFTFKFSETSKPGQNKTETALLQAMKGINVVCYFDELTPDIVNTCQSYKFASLKSTLAVKGISSD